MNKSVTHCLILLLLLLTGITSASIPDTSSISRLLHHATLFDINTKGGLDSSLFYLNEAGVIAQQLESQHHLYSVYDQFNKIFQQSGNYALALEYLFRMMALLDKKSTDVHDTIDFDRRYASLYTQIGNCYFNLNNFKCLGYYKKSLEVVRKLKTEDPAYPAGEREVLILTNIGSAYLDNYKFDTAEAYFVKALELNGSQGDPVSEASLYNNLGIVFKEKRDFEKAFVFYLKALKIRSQLNDTNGIAQTYNNLGDAYCLTGKHREAIEVLHNALEMSKQMGNIRSQMKAANFLSVAYDQIGDYQQAFSMHKTYSTLNDSLINYENIQNSIRLEMQYQHEKQIRENEIQQQIALAKKERLVLIYMMVSAFLLALITILILLYRNQKIRARNSTLEKDKLEMELDFRNKELSTNVLYLLKKNEFISSIARKLLNLQENSIDDHEREQLIHDLLKDLQANIDSTVWSEFEVRFQQVHKDFYRKLMTKYPDLTPNEIKICAFLKLNMTSKEISAITYQSVKSLEVARHRLRKKMGIDRDENLVALLQNL